MAHARRLALFGLSASVALTATSWWTYAVARFVPEVPRQVTVVDLRRQACLESASAFVDAVLERDWDSASEFWSTVQDDSRNQPVISEWLRKSSTKLEALGDAELIADTQYESGAREF